MKIILLGEAKKHPEAIGLLNEDLILDPKRANEALSLKNLQIEKIEVVSGEKVIYVSEKKTNLLNG